jgi:hypothetical protein
VRIHPRGGLDGDTEAFDRAVETGLGNPLRIHLEVGVPQGLGLGERHGQLGSKQVGQGFRKVVGEGEGVVHGGVVGDVTQIEDRLVAIDDVADDLELNLLIVRREGEDTGYVARKLEPVLPRRDGGDRIERAELDEGLAEGPDVVSKQAVAQGRIAQGAKIRGLRVVAKRGDGPLAQFGEFWSCRFRWRFGT